MRLYFIGGAADLPNLSPRLCGNDKKDRACETRWNKAPFDSLNSKDIILICKRTL